MKDKTKLKIENIFGWILAIFMLIATIYYILGISGLLPDYFYEQCENIDKETAIIRGCCEDRDMSYPVSWLFGESDCNEYPDKNKTEIIK